MSFEQPLERVGLFLADIDMSSIPVWQFAPVWLGPAQNIASSTGSPGNAAIVAKGTLTTPAYGILQNAPVQGEPAALVTAGISKCLVSTAVTTVGSAVKLIAGGCAPAASGDGIDGYALETGAAGAIIAVHLLKNGKA